MGSAFENKGKNICYENLIFRAKKSVKTDLVPRLVRPRRATYALRGGVQI